MDFKIAQNDMRYAYFGGGTGVFASGLIWCIAGISALLYSNDISMWTLFFGGMFIHPLGMLFSKLLKRLGTHKSNNPLAVLALEGTIILFVGLFLAFFVAKHQVEWFYPIMLMAIGVRYLTFNTLYGAKTYWFLGLILILSGMLCIMLDTQFVTGAFIGGITEILLSILIMYQARKTTE